jgi:hypothetical protein
MVGFSSDGSITARSGDLEDERIFVFIHDV